jgi:hypothetical protein
MILDDVYFCFAKCRTVNNVIHGGVVFVISLAGDVARHRLRNLKAEDLKEKSNWTKRRHRKGKRERGATGKSIVFGFLEPNGRVY